MGPGVAARSAGYPVPGDVISLRGPSAAPVDRRPPVSSRQGPPVLIRHITADRSRDLVVTIDDPDATIGDLADALEPDLPTGPLLVDGRSVSAATPLDRAGLGDGAVISRPDAVGPSLPPSSCGSAPWGPVVASLVTTTGFDAGHHVALRAGTYRLGRRSEGVAGRPADPWTITIDDATVSRDQAEVTVDRDGSVRVCDRDSANGTWIGPRVPAEPAIVVHGDWFRCGATRISVVAPRADPGSGPTSGPHPHHRSPRPGRSVPDAPIGVPTRGDEASGRGSVGLVAVGASVAMAGAMVILLGSWTYAAFALLGPVLMIANGFDARRRRRRDGRRSARELGRDLLLLRSELGVRQAMAVAERSDRYLGVQRVAEAIGPAGSPACWARRLGDHDAGAVRIGMGTVPWDPPLTGEPESWADGARKLVGEHRLLVDAPVGLDLTAGHRVALVGSGMATRSLARSIIVQAATIHGPADLQVAVLAGPAEAPSWAWTAWLPHSQAPQFGSLLAGTPEASDLLSATLTAPVPVPTGAPGHGTAGSPPLTLVVVDDAAGLAKGRSPGRTVLRASVDPHRHLAALIIVATGDDVPAACTTVLHVADDGTLIASEDLVHGTGVVTGITGETAATLARALARLIDPEVADAGRGLPESVRLSALLGPDAMNAAGLAARWTSAGPDPAPRAVIGATADGPLAVDLAADGPHLLVAGTTGSGKSELLRTLVASLATGSSPDHICFVLIDFKGGGAFDACARLPHTVGVVTDLDGPLAARALRCLEAELRHRERRLRGAGADDLAALRRTGVGDEPLPRLVVVIDEFATLASELPDFVTSLVGIAQRGRSLGVHLVLATQRPSGSVSASITANTSLCIALRMQSGEDSTDVIGVPDAAQLPRLRAGRALVRVGPGDLVATQTALVTATYDCAELGRSDTPAVRVGPLGFSTAEKVGDPASPDTGPARTDLAVMVTQMAAAWSACGGHRPRTPWPDPLPDEVAWPIPASGDHAGSAGGRAPGIVLLGLTDQPDRQRQVATGWDLAQGPLLLVGLPGSGTTTAAATVTLGVAQRWGPRSAHVHVIDLGDGGLGHLAGLAQVGAVIGADETERQRRLLDELGQELQDRRGATPPKVQRRPVRFLVVDGIGAFADRWDPLEASGTWDRLVELIGQGTAVGMHVAICGEAAAAVPHRVVAMCRQRLLFRLGDPADYAPFGIAPSLVPPMTPGRAVVAETGEALQVGRPTDGRAAAVARLASRRWPEAVEIGRGGGTMPDPVGVLPDHVWLAEMSGPPSRSDADGTLAITVGRADAGLGPAVLRLDPGGHAIVAGPPRSGRSTALLTLAEAAATSGVPVIVVAGPGGDRSTSGWPAGAIVCDPEDAALAGLVDRRGPALILVDDADRLAEDHPVLTSVAADRRPDRHLVIAGRSDRLRGGYGHWTRELRADRTGLLLVPDPDVDGELLAARLPRVAPVCMRPGLGWLAGGAGPDGYIQVARPGSLDR